MSRAAECLGVRQRQRREVSLARSMSGVQAGHDGQRI